MSQLSPSELAKVRKSALHSVTLLNEIKTSVIDAELKALSLEIKKKLTRKGVLLEVLVLVLPKN